MALARRDIAAQYRQSLLGYIWAFLPIFGTTFVFLFLRSGGAFETGENPISYPVYIFVGTLLWQLFTDAFNGGMRVVNSSKQMLVKINFPREALIIAGMWITLFNFVVRISVLIPAMIFFAWKDLYTFSWNSLVLFPVGVLSVILLGYSLGLLLIPVNILFGDVQKAVNMLMMFWMFISPVVVTIPETGVVSTVMRLNPVGPVLDTARSWLVGVDPQLAGHYLVVTALSLVCLIFGWIFYRIAMPHVVVRLGM